MDKGIVLQAALFSALLLAGSIIDCRRRVIPNIVCILTALTGLICFSPVNLLGLFAALPLLIAAMGKENSVGGGDIKLTAAAGLVLGFRRGLMGLCLGLLLAVLYYSIKIMTMRLQKKQTPPIQQASLPMAPFLSIGFMSQYFLEVFQ